MNEKIKALAEQAEEYASADGTGMQCQKWRDKFQEKFAELIIQESINAVEVENGRRIGEIDISILITEHFGIK